MFYLEEGHEVSSEEFKQRAIAIDTEFRASGQFGEITRVYCVACTDAQGRVFKQWLMTPDPQIIEKIKAFYGIAKPIFVCHALEKAERQALLWCGADPDAYRWLDTWVVYSMVHNAAAKNFANNSAEAKKARAEARSTSYAAMCKHLLGVNIDTAHKEQMRLKCILGTADDFKDAILDYCASDTQWLIPAVLKLGQSMCKAMNEKRYLCILPLHTSSVIEMWLRMGDSIRAFARIAERGFPVNADNARALSIGAGIQKDQLIEEFVKTYPDTYVRNVKSIKTLEKNAPLNLIHQLRVGTIDVVSAEKLLRKHMHEAGKAERTIETCVKQLHFIGNENTSPWKKQSAVCEELFKQCLRSRNIHTWPMTDAGDHLRMDGASLDEEFKGETGNFGADYRKLTYRMSAFNAISGTESTSNWLKNLDVEHNIMRYGSLHPYGTSTARCAARPAEGVVPLWYKSFHGILEPPAGKWLVESDFGSEEVFITACLMHDAAYYELYHAKDPYLWFCAELGTIPKSDFEQLSKAELKEKYHDERKTMKRFQLAWQYGAGVDTLARRSQMPVQRVKELKYKLENELFATSTAYKERLKRILQGYDFNHMLVDHMIDPDGWCLRTKARQGEGMSMTAMLNWPIQSLGGTILHQLVIELEKANIECVATVHDAVLYLVDENDYDAIHKVEEIMRSTANRIVHAPTDWTIKVGDPEIWQHGEIHCDELENTEECKHLIALGRAAISSEE